MTKINWTFIQDNSDKVLSDGLFKLQNSPKQTLNTQCQVTSGNYLISHGEVSYYIGEGKNLSRRLRQQLNPKTSTFYKNLLVFQQSNKFSIGLSIEDFKVQLLDTDIGRKEIEEFGISNVPTLLNRFQLGKRKSIKIANQSGLWDKVQAVKSEVLLQAENEIFSRTFNPWFDRNVLEVAGLYIVRNNCNKIIYIGESSDISERFHTHSNNTYFSALRRHIGTEILQFELQDKNGKKKYLDISEENKITAYLKSCDATFHPVNLGRFELEEFLIKKYMPVLNRKDNDIALP